MAGRHKRSSEKEGERVGVGEKKLQNQRRREGSVEWSDQARLFEAVGGGEGVKGQSKGCRRGKERARKRERERYCDWVLDIQRKENNSCVSEAVTP